MGKGKSSLTPQEEYSYNNDPDVILGYDNTRDLAGRIFYMFSNLSVYDDEKQYYTEIGDGVNVSVPNWDGITEEKVLEFVKKVDDTYRDVNLIIRVAMDFNIFKILVKGTGFTVDDDFNEFLLELYWEYLVSFKNRIEEIKKNMEELKDGED